ncbi:MAG TPA: phage/plasmid primase, P4 family [Candidatus Sulfotelmatobacter sp.]|nr:phage/plasmid primase, P4 family [Candidatus Sulfotelmatobacter sp.]
MSRLERSILGAILLDAGVYEQAAELRPEDFSLDSHRRIFMRMGDLAVSGRPIDILTVIEELEHHKELQSVGDAHYVSGLVEGVPDRPSIQHYVKMMRAAGDRRRAAKIVEHAQRLTDDPSVSTAALAEIGNDLRVLVADSEPVPPRLSEEALALRFSRQYADDLRYVSSWGHWMCWDGLRWTNDNTLHVFDLARGICRKASAECGDARDRTAMRIAAAQTVTAIERLARADRRHAARVEQWDTNVWLLNTPQGTVDLRTGKIHEHTRDEYITKITATGPGGNCPIWLQFLARVTGGDPELQSFLQRMVGYTLTGSTCEQALFFLYGTGANGKSVYLSTISALLAGYAKTAPASSFTASANEQHPTDLAGLRGARFVTAIETEDGSRWAESKIKSLTGGDKIAARFMRGDFFEFIPEFKLVIAGNHKPGLRSVDEAMRRRFHLVPFTVAIPQEERDPSLTEKLRAEFPGILAWAIQGCLEWQQDGLNPPAIVRDATADYLASEDVIGCWLEDECFEDEALWTSSAALSLNYTAWCQRTAEKPISPKRLTQALDARGFVQKRTSSARGFSGIGLRRRMTDVTDGPVISVTSARERPI